MVYIFSIEGNIGSGKSTLVNKLKNIKINDTELFLLQEPVSLWESIKDPEGISILSKFYADKEKYAFPFQMMAFISRLKEISECIKLFPDDIIITERSVFTDAYVFAKMLYDDKLIDSVCYQIYNQWFDYFTQDINITGYIYLDIIPEECVSRIKNRNREGEIIELDYLNKCRDYHDEWLDKEKNVLIIKDNNDISTIINFIKNNLKK
jgi:deoxyadenosine/deoxycytidine kinase